MLCSGNVFPHMHLRGKDFEYKAVFPDGRTETLLRAALRLRLADDSTGSKSRWRCPRGRASSAPPTVDNSDKNLNNPDPTKLVRWGDQTWEEMMIGFVDYSLRASRKPKRNRR